MGITRREFLVGSTTLVAFSVTACGDDDSPVAAGTSDDTSMALSTVRDAIDLEMAAIDARLDEAARKLGSTTADAKAELQDMLDHHPAIVRVYFIDASGTVQTSVPEGGAVPAGMPITEVAADLENWTSEARARSDVLDHVGDTNMFALKHPVYRESVAHAGAIIVFVAPYQFLKPAIEGSGAPGDLTYVVGQPDGNLLHDPDEGDLYRNVITDEEFSRWPELQALAKSVSGSESGVANYSYLDATTGETDSWIVRWDTCLLHGHPWRVLAQGPA